MSTSPPDIGLLCERWRAALPDTVPPFDLITHSIPLMAEDGSLGHQGNKDDDEDVESFPCECRYDPDLPREECACGPLSKCINRDLFIECISGDCPSGNYCQNQRFQRLQYSAVEVTACGPKGHGLKAMEDLKR